MVDLDPRNVPGFLVLLVGAILLHLVVRGALFGIESAERLLVESLVLGAVYAASFVAWLVLFDGRTD